MSTTPEATTPEPEEGPFTAHYHNVRFEGFSFWSGKSQKEARNHAVRLNTMTAKYRLRIRELEAALEVRESQLQLARESRQELLDHIRFITHPITADIARRAREQAPTGDAPSDEEASPVVVNEPSVADASSDAEAPAVAEASPIPERKQHWWIKIRKREDRYATASYQVRKRPEWHDRVISFVHERDKCKYHFSADVYEITVSHFYDDECGLPNKRNEWDYTTTSE